jgi:hypothetical protein
MSRKSAKVNQPRFTLIQFEIKLGKTFFERFGKSFSVSPVLKTHYKVIAKPNHDNIATSLPASPLFDPKIERVMEINVGKYGADACALWDAFFAVDFSSVFEHTSVQPLLDVSYHPPVRNSVLDELYQPFMGDGTKTVPNVCIKHPVYLSRYDRRT